MPSNRYKMLQALKGETKYGVLWAPRMDIWYYSNLYRNTLPEEFKGLTLKQIIKKLGIIYNKYLPDWAGGYKIEATKDRLLGIYTHKDIPYEIKLDKSIKRKLTENNGLVEVSYITPKGTVKGSFQMNEFLKNSGVTLPPIKEFLIKSAKDYDIVMEIFSSIKVIPKPENYKQLCSEIGDDGYPPIYGHLAASPMQAILRDLIEPTQFFIEYKLNLGRLLELSKILEKFLLDIVNAVTDYYTEPIVVWGGNYDSALTFPPFFRDHILPFLNKVCDIIHAKNGRVIGHCDGENDKLLPLYRESGMDILQSVNVKPMVKNSYREIRNSLRQEQVISGGIPSILLLKSSISDEQFKNFLNELKKSYKKGERLILEVSDNVPPDADMDRLKIIGEFADKL